MNNYNDLLAPRTFYESHFKIFIMFLLHSLVVSTLKLTGLAMLSNGTGPLGHCYFLICLAIRVIRVCTLFYNKSLESVDRHNISIYLLLG